MTSTRKKLLLKVVSEILVYHRVDNGSFYDIVRGMFDDYSYNEASDEEIDELINKPLSVTFTDEIKGE